jgi:2-C-methyl-D-erythritol 4-phosphate cytidylyltransferase
MDRPEKWSKSPRFRCWGLIVAAGSAQRYGQEPPKQYQLVGDVPLLQFSLNCFNAVPDIAGMVVGISAIDRWFDSLCQAPDKFLGVFVGGASRSETVLRGLEALTSHAEADDWVLVHDAARPCLRVSDLQYLIDEVVDEEVGGILAAPVWDTLKVADRHGNVRKTLCRQRVWRAMTPQMFRLGALTQALNACSGSFEDVADEASAIERLGRPVKLVRGRDDNLKVTVEADLDRVAAILKNEGRF